MTRCQGILSGLYDDPRNLEAFARQWQRDLREAILAFPTEQLAQVFPAKSPFDFYCWLRAQCASARKRLIYVDRYSSADLFHRYLRGADPSVQITVVAAREGPSPGKWAEFLSVSHVFAAQRPATYALVDADIHDRHVVVDDRAFHLGPSSKDAAFRTDASVAAFNVSEVEAVVAKGRQLFGPTATTHP